MAAHFVKMWVNEVPEATPPVGEAQFGTFEAGKIADLVVLDADPLEDNRNTLSIDRVMKGGAWVEREGLLPVR